MGLEEGFKFKKKKQQSLIPEWTDTNNFDLNSKQFAEPSQQPTEITNQSLEIDQSVSAKIDRTFEGETEIYGLELPSSDPQPTKQQPPKLKIPIVNLKEI